MEAGIIMAYLRRKSSLYVYIYNSCWWATSPATIAVMGVIYHLSRRVNRPAPGQKSTAWTTFWAVIIGFYHSDNVPRAGCTARR